MTDIVPCVCGSSAQTPCICGATSPGAAVLEASDRALDLWSANDATCTRCHAEPRHGSSELGERCLWPERGDGLREECPKCRCAYPPDLVGNICPNCKNTMPPVVASYRQAAGFDPMEMFVGPIETVVIPGYRPDQPRYLPPGRFNCDRETCAAYVDIGHATTEEQAHAALRVLGWSVVEGERAYHWCAGHAANIVGTTTPPRST